MLFEGVLALDEQLYERLSALNSKAMRNIVDRILEAKGCGFWSSDSAMIEQLHDIYAEMEDQTEVGEAA